MICLDVHEVPNLPGRPIQISIGTVDRDGGGSGYRIAGPKFAGNSRLLRRVELNARQAAEIRRYLDKVAP